MEDKSINKCFACGKELTKDKSCSCYGHIYCAKHYQQMLKHGHCLDSNPRTTKDLNDFEFIDEKTVKIITYNQRSDYAGSFLISPEDFERVIVKKWRIWKNRVYHGNFKIVILPRFLLEEELRGREWMVVDHINSNPLDNRRENLRIVPQAKNALNKVPLSNNSTEVLGV